MANTHKQFQDYLGKIRLTAAKRDNLKGSRKANRDRICKHFGEVLKRPVPEFKGQGSFSMRTNLNPLNGAEYDLDDGVYLLGLGTDESKWPTPETVHGWIVDAVKNATSEPPINKARCVRVRYAADYHIDLPIYARDANGVPKIFELRKPPYESNPVAFTEWFNQQVSDKGSQLKPIARYLKGWRDFQGGDAKIASGLALTILASNHFIKCDRDDEALVKVVGAMVSHLEWGGSIKKPVTPFEDLSANWTSDQRSKFIAKLKTLRDRGQDALDEDEDAEGLETATGIWRQLLGDRFPLVEAPEKNKSGAPLQTPSPVIIPSQPARSA